MGSSRFSGTTTQIRSQLQDQQRRGTQLQPTASERCWRRRDAAKGRGWSSSAQPSPLAGFAWGRFKHLKTSGGGPRFPASAAKVFSAVPPLPDVPPLLRSNHHNSSFQSFIQQNRGRPPFLLPTPGERAPPEPLGVGNDSAARSRAATPSRPSAACREDFGISADSRYLAWFIAAVTAQLSAGL